MQQPAINEWILQSRQGNTQAFRRLVETHQTMVYTLAFRILCNEGDAEDVVQETFIRVWKNLETFKTEMKFTTWLFTIATHLCYDRLKALKRKTGSFPIDGEKFQHMQIESAENIETSAINSELAEIILRLTDELTPKQKLVFTLRDLEGLETEEMMTITGLSAEKIKSNLYLARQYIRKKLEKME